MTETTDTGKTIETMTNVTDMDATTESMNDTTDTTKADQNRPRRNKTSREGGL